MEFRTRINVSPSDFKIDHQTKMLLFGSCFAESIGKFLIDNKFNLNLNPFGVLYNPSSISHAIELLLDQKDFTDDDIFKHQGLFHTFWHHSSFSNSDSKEFLQNINQCRQQASYDLENADILIITLGTSYVFREKSTNQVVGNCHKLPANIFDRYRLTIKDIVSAWDQLIKKVGETNASLKILFTVSPIRHWKDGAHNNQLSKASLLLAIDELKERHPNVFYFPSYEIVLDELRDYRFYAEDMIHPNEIAIRYICQVFVDTYFSVETKDINNQYVNISKAINHRAFNPNTELHKQFLRQTLLNIEKLRNKYPFFDLEKEMQLINEKLSLID